MLSEWLLECTRVHALTGVVNEIADKVTIACHLDGADCHTPENVSQHRNALLRRQEEYLAGFGWLASCTSFPVSAGTAQYLDVSDL